MARCKPVLISNKVNIWQDVITDGAGLVEEDSLDGIHRLLSRWLDLSEEQRMEISQKATQSFARRYSMKSAAIAIRNMFEQQIDLRKTEHRGQFRTARNVTFRMVEDF